MAASGSARIVFYGISTCIHCKRARAFLDSKGADYELHWVDEAEGEERAGLLREVKRYNPRISFPTMVFDGKEVVVGDDLDGIAEALSDLPLHAAKQTQKHNSAPPEVKEMMERLAPIQAKQGYHFNPEGTIAEELMEQLLQCKKKLGYMCCPCRLPSGDKDHDRDITCPCAYRAPDVAEYGVCYCGLYEGDNASAAPKRGQRVPERRPVEKMV